MEALSDSRELNNSHLQRLKGELHLRDRGLVTPDILRLLAEADLNRFFECKDNLDRAIRLDLLTFHYASYYNFFRGSIFEAFLYHLLTLYRSCRDNVGTQFLDLFGLWEGTINRGAHNLAEVAHLERSKNVQRLDLCAKILFQEIGEITEGCLKPHLRLLHAMRVLLAKRVSACEATDTVCRAPFGVTVKILVEEDENLAVLYQHMLMGIKLHEWRNVAQHDSYSVTDTARITFAYGKNLECKRTLTREELQSIAFAIHQLYGIHKLAHVFFFLDNIECLGPYLHDGPASDDSVAMQIVETAYGGGFEVIQIERDKHPWSVLLQDAEHRCLEDKEKAIKKLLPVFCALRREMSIKLVGDNGILLSGTQITCSRNTDNGGTCTE